MTYCEDCKWYRQRFFEDAAECEKKKKPVEATDTACAEYDAPEGQMKLEGMA